MVIDPARVEALLAQCDKEDRFSPPERRFLYTSEIRRLLGVEPQDPQPYSALEEEIRKSQEG